MHQQPSDKTRLVPNDKTQAAAALLSVISFALLACIALQATRLIAQLQVIFSSMSGIY